MRSLCVCVCVCVCVHAFGYTYTLWLVAHSCPYGSLLLHHAGCHGYRVAWLCDSPVPLTLFQTREVWPAEQNHLSTVHTRTHTHTHTHKQTHPSKTRTNIPQTYVHTHRYTLQTHAHIPHQHTHTLTHTHTGLTSKNTATVMSEA